MNKKIIAFEEDTRHSMQAEKLLVMIESVMKSVNMQYQDLDYLAVTIGPGSFNGIRIAVATARGILHGTELQTIPITNFETSHYRASNQVKTYDKSIILLDAYRNQCYLQMFDQNNMPLTQPQLINNNDIPAFLSNQKEENIICSGSGIKTIWDKIHSVDTKNIMFLPRFQIVKAVHIARLAFNKIQNNQFDKISPLYIRMPDAKLPDNSLNKFI